MVQRLSSGLVKHKGKTLATLLDAASRDVISAEWFGVTVGGADNEQALYDLSMHLSTMVIRPTKVVFPHGVSLVGSQKLAGQTGLGYAYEPSYFVRNFPSIEGRAYLFVSMTQADIELDMSGWTLKRNDGSRIGSFDPVTGAPAPDQTGVTGLNRDFRADSGNLMILFKAHNVKVKGGKLDGNIPGTIWGGKFGDDGWQMHAYNLWINQCGGVKFEDFTSISSPVDCVYFSETSDFYPDELGDYPLTQFKNCRFTDAGRNVVSLCGGANIEFISTPILRGGGKAIGINGHQSLPQSCIDIEAEGGRVHDVRFFDCNILDASNDIIQIFPAVGDVSLVRFSRCRIKGMHGEAAVTVLQGDTRGARGVILDSCKIVGGILNSSTGREAVVVEDCDIRNNYGGSYVDKFRITGRFEKLNRNSVEYSIPNVDVNYPVFDVSAGDAVPGGLGVRSQCRDNIINLSGASDNIKHVDLGGFTYYRDLTLHVEAGGLTGTKALAVYCANSSAGVSGLSTTSSLINFGAGMVKVGGANLWYGANDIHVGGTLVPVVDNALDIGKRGKDFSHVSLNDGVYLWSKAGQRYKVAVRDDGVVLATPV